MNEHKQVPLMQREGYVYRAHKNVRTHCVKVGDLLLDKRHGKEDERWTVLEATEGVMSGLVHVVTPSGKFCIGRRGERVWVARAE